MLIVRLTANPWLIDYDHATHWTLWTYGGALVLALLALLVLRAAPEERRGVVPNLNSLLGWLEGASLHLFVLFVWTELRYWLNDGNVFVDRIDVLEVGLYVVLFGVLSTVYYVRGNRSGHVRWLYQIFSTGMYAVALFSYLLLVWGWLTSESWLYQDVDVTPVFNRALLYFGAPVVVFGVAWRYNRPTFKLFSAVVTGVAAFVFVSVEIHHLWTATLSMRGAMAQGELVTYSVAWLVMAVFGLLWGAWRQSVAFYRAGMLLLVVVIAKIFLVDMSDTQGLLRVLSFMGLGLALLGVSFLHQRLSRRASHSQPIAD